MNGRALFYVNRVKQAEWNISKVNADEIGKCGASFSISPNVFTSTNSFQVGRIRVLPWDGKEPVNGGEPAKPRVDQVLQIHGPSMDGLIERITEREILFRDPARSA